jgi:hypothetical protein
MKRARAYSDNRALKGLIVTPAERIPLGMFSFDQSGHIVGIISLKRLSGENDVIKSTEEKLNVAGAELVMVKAGSGKPLLILHDELGYPGWMTWNETLAHERTLLLPLQPGYGKTPKLDWIMN